jgi:hypothetical protein
MPNGGNKDCTLVAAAPVLPAGYVVSASRIADRRMNIGGVSVGGFTNAVNSKLSLKEIQFNSSV